MSCRKMGLWATPAATLCTQARMNQHGMFNPRNHQEDVFNAFQRFTRKFGYIYDGMNLSRNGRTHKARMKDFLFSIENFHLG